MVTLNGRGLGIEAVMGWFVTAGQFGSIASITRLSWGLSIAWKSGRLTLVNEPLSKNGQT